MLRPFPMAKCSSLRELESDYLYWENKSVHQLYHLLEDSLIHHPLNTPLPDSPHIQPLLESISRRLNELATDDLVNSCLHFILDAQNSGNIGRGMIGEKYLQMSAVVHHHLKIRELSASIAGILCDVYRLRSCESHLKLKLFKTIAVEGYHDGCDDEKSFYHQTHVNHHSQEVIKNLASTSTYFFQDYLSARDYHEQHMALVNLSDHLKMVKAGQASSGNSHAFFESEKIENNTVEVAMTLHWLNANFFTAMTLEDARLLLELDALFPDNPFELAKIFAQYQSIIDKKPSAICHLINAYVQSNAATDEKCQFDLDLK